MDNNQVNDQVNKDQAIDQSQGGQMNDKSVSLEEKNKRLFLASIVLFVLICLAVGVLAYMKLLVQY